MQLSLLTSFLCTVSFSPINILCSAETFSGVGVQRGKEGLFRQLEALEKERA